MPYASMNHVLRHYNEPSFAVRDMMTDRSDPRHCFVLGSESVFWSYPRTRERSYG